MASFGSVEAPVGKTQNKVSPATYVVAGLLVVAFAGFSAFHVTSSSMVVSTMTLEDEAFSAAAGNVVNCDPSAEGFLESVPKYDPAYTSTGEAFYNACYYSYRCCTTQYSGCYVSANFGDKCRECLKTNGPRMVRQTCDLYAHQKGIDGKPWSALMVETEQSVPQFTEINIMEDSGFPETEITDFKLKFCEVTMVKGDIDSTCSGKGYPSSQTDKPDLQTCWVQVGPADRRMEQYESQCFEVISWCNLLCPRDTANSNQHNMCKHCTLFGFDMKKDVIASQQETGRSKQGIKEAADDVAAADVKADWHAKWTQP